MPPSEGRIRCERLGTRDGLAVLKELLPDKVTGLRILLEESGLYNKWLYRVSDEAGNAGVLGLSRRFCPAHNKWYAGGSIYLLDGRFKRRETARLFGRIETAARKLLRVSKDKRDGKERFRGPIEGLTRVQQRGVADKVCVSENWVPMEWATDPGGAAAERRRTTWRAEGGPVWAGRTWEVAAATHADIEAVCHLQGLSGESVAPDSPLKLGIDYAVTYLERHRHMAIYTFGTFFVAARRGEPVVRGCAWCFRSFDPLRSCWTLWLRRIIIPDGEHRGAVVRALTDAAVGVFAEAGYPSRVRTLVPTARRTPAPPVSREDLTDAGFNELEPAGRQTVYVGLPDEIF